MSATKMTTYKTTGTKGSDVYSGTGDPRLDLSVAMVRGSCPDLLGSLAKASATIDIADAFVLAFHSRNVRGGKGERDVFRAILMALHEIHPQLVEDLLDLVPQFGSWNDLLLLADKMPLLKNRIGQLFATQLKTDRDTPAGKGITLAAKWAPREKQGGSGAGSKSVTAAFLAEILFPEIKLHSARMRCYRKLVSDLNRRADTIEVHMAGRDWTNIKPAGVPGRAGKLYARALLNLTKARSDNLRHPDDPDRMACREHFLAHFAAAKEGKATVHGSKTLFPHELVKQARNAAGLTEPHRDQIRAIWKDMIRDAQTGLRDCIFMCDFSGSMQSSGTNGDTPYWVSMALGLLGATANAGPWSGRFLTFDSTPQWHTVPSSGDLFEALECINDRVSQGTSTDFQRAMDMVLTHVKKERLRPEQLPRYLVVLTDMNFDAACGSSSVNLYTGYGGYRNHVKTAPWQTHFEAIQESFRRAGEDMWGLPFVPPQIVCWNLAANPTDFHATAETPGVSMLSGWSPTQFKILTQEGPRQMTPMEVLRLEIDDPQYQIVRDRVAAFTSASASASASV